MMPSSLRPWVEGFIFSAAIALIVALNSGLVVTEKPGEHNADFNVFQASKLLATDGQNPYEADVLMAELSKPDGPYDVEYRRNPELQRRYFFNPPLWLTTLEVTGYWAAFFVTGSAFLFGAALWAWRSAVAWPIWAMVPIVFAWDKTILSYNGRIGQTGYLIAALIGFAVLYSRRSTSRLSSAPDSSRSVWKAASAAALLAYKPHIWFAQWIVLLKQNRPAALRQFGLSVGLGIASIAQFGPDLWIQYVRSIFETHDRFAGGLSITFASLNPQLATTSLVLVMAVATLLGITFLLKANLLRPQAEQVVTIALIMMASGHALWYDWAWLVMVPLFLGWNRWLAALFLLAYPVSYWVELYTGSNAWTLLLIAGILFNELRRSLGPPEGGPQDGAGDERAVSASSDGLVSASAATP